MVPENDFLQTREELTSMTVYIVYKQYARARFNCFTITSQLSQPSKSLIADCCSLILSAISTEQLLDVHSMSSSNFVCSSAELNWIQHRRWDYPPPVSSTRVLLIGRSRSFKVGDFIINRKRVCDFLLVIHSNIGPILHRFWNTATYWLK